MESDPQLLTVYVLNFGQIINKHNGFCAYYSMMMMMINMMIFTPGSKLPCQQILPTLILPPWTAFTIMGPDRTYHAS